MKISNIPDYIISGVCGIAFIITYFFAGKTYILFSGILFLISSLISFVKKK